MKQRWSYLTCQW